MAMHRLITGRQRNYVVKQSKPLYTGSNPVHPTKLFVMIKNIIIAVLFILSLCLGLSNMWQKDDYIELNKKYATCLFDAGKKPSIVKRYFLISYNWKDVKGNSGSGYNYLQIYRFPGMKELNNNLHANAQSVVTNITELNKIDFEYFIQN